MRLRDVSLLVAGGVLALGGVWFLNSVVGVDDAADAQASALPRTADGKPDLSGLWQVMNTANYDIEDHPASPGVPAGMGVIEGNEIPYQPWALAKKQENYKNRATQDTEAKCYLTGVPRITYMPFPFQILQKDDIVTVLYEYAHATRHIYTNGTSHPTGHIPWYMGDSRGQWEGDTLVVDTTHFNDETWFDRAGNFHSDALHVIERYTLIDPDHINYEVTIEDPKVFTRPWKMTMIINRHKEKNFQLLSYDCIYGFELEKYFPYPELAVK
jgi:hypothetical protein